MAAVHINMSSVSVRFALVQVQFLRGFCLHNPYEQTSSQDHFGPLSDGNGDVRQLWTRLSVGELCLVWVSVSLDC